MTSEPSASIGFDSAIGRLRVTATASRITRIQLNAPPLPDGSGHDRAMALCHRAREQIEAFLDGERQSFELPIHVAGSPFRRAVWKEMLHIPYGRTWTYGQMARRVGDVGASRAVGAACGANPLPLVVPCHRVVAAHGLGGFGGGVPMKRWLLALELYGRPADPALLEKEPLPGEDEEPRFDDSLDRGEQQSLF